MKYERVYFIRPIGMRGPIKIGCSVSPDGRRKTLQLWSPFPLEVIAEIAGGRKLEYRFHAAFAEDHLGHEWFTWSERLQSVADQVAAGTFDVATLPEPRVLRRPKAGNGWTDQTRRQMSYSSRIRHLTKKTGHRLPRDVYVALGNPEMMAKVEAYLADPLANGVSREEYFAPIEQSRRDKAAVEWLKDNGYVALAHERMSTPTDATLAA